MLWILVQLIVLKISRISSGLTKKYVIILNAILPELETEVCVRIDLYLYHWSMLWRRGHTGIGLRLQHRYDMIDTTDAAASSNVFYSMLTSPNHCHDPDPTLLLTIYQGVNTQPNITKTPGTWTIRHILLTCVLIPYRELLLYKTMLRK